LIQVNGRAGLRQGLRWIKYDGACRG